MNTRQATYYKQALRSGRFAPRFSVGCGVWGSLKANYLQNDMFGVQFNPTGQLLFVLSNGDTMHLNGNSSS